MSELKKILEEMRKFIRLDLGVWPDKLKVFADRIEKELAKMGEPVAWKESITDRFVSDSQKKISSISYDTYTVPLYLSPPDQTKRIEEMEKCVAFFASVIKSGESWTDECEKAKNSALSQEGVRNE